MCFEYIGQANVYFDHHLINTSTGYVYMAVRFSWYSFVFSSTLHIANRIKNFFLFFFFVFNICILFSSLQLHLKRIERKMGYARFELSKHHLVIHYDWFSLSQIDRHSWVCFEQWKEKNLDLNRLFILFLFLFWRILFIKLKSI